MRTMSIDLETRSSADIARCGVYRYSEDADFRVLLFGVSVDGGPVTVYDIAMGETLPAQIVAALTDENVTKYAYNAAFERVCLSRWLGLDGFLDPAQWRCTMVWAAYNGLPLSLEQCGAAIGLERQKLREGRELIRTFCVPRQDGSFTDPAEQREKWELFKRYNMRDVECEMSIQEKLRNFPVPERVWEEYRQDQEINDRGIRVDRKLVQNAIELDARSQEELGEKMRRLTGLENPNSVSQLKGYLNENGIKTESLGKKQVKELLTDAEGEPREVLELRLATAKSSVKKYEAMENAVCRDGRCRGMFQFYGASRSGRWAGRLIQLQNLPQNHMEDLEQARELVKQGDHEMLNLLYGTVPAVLSELVRTAFVPEEGMKFIVADFSAIEARVHAHLAGEDWRAEVFRNGGDIYCASASQMFKVPVEKHGANAHLRQKGKIAELALGYGGGTGALESMGALQLGLKEEELQPLVTMWRVANPNIVRLWWDVDAAVKLVIRERCSAELDNLRFEFRSGMLRIRLPSGRELSYVKPTLCENRFGGEGVCYLGLNAQKKWDRIESYGPKFVENITQAVSRDILAEAMGRLSGYRIVGHVHDEVIIEAPPDTSVQEVCREMGRTPAWLPGICLRADGYECGFYRKE